MTTQWKMIKKDRDEIVQLFDRQSFYRRFRRFRRFIHQVNKILSIKKLVEYWIPGETLVGFQTLS